MKRTGFILTTVAYICCTAANAQIMYSNLPPGQGALMFSPGLTPRWNTGDDLTLGPGFSSGGLVKSFVTGFNLIAAPTGSTTVDMEVLLWNSVDFSAPANEPVFTNLAGSFFINGIANSTTAIGAHVLTPFDLTSLSGGGVTLTSGTVGLQIKFWDNTGGNRVAAANTTSLFYGVVPPTVGSNEDVYWRDANGDGQITGEEIRTVGAGQPLLSQMVAQLSASPVPEPASMAVLGLGALVLIRRRCLS